MNTKFHFGSVPQVQLHFFRIEMTHSHEISVFSEKLNWVYRKLVRYCDTCAIDFATEIPRAHISPNQRRTLLIWRHSMACYKHKLKIQMTNTNRSKNTKANAHFSASH